MRAEIEPAVPVATTAAPGPNRAELVERCWRYIQKMPDAISGQGGHNATFAAACICFRFGLTDSEAEEIMRRFNTTKTGSEQWSQKELAHKLADAREKVVQNGKFGEMARGDISKRASEPKKPKRPPPPYRSFPVEALPEPVAAFVTEGAKSLGL